MKRMISMKSGLVILAILAVIACRSEREKKLDALQKLEQTLLQDSTGMPSMEKAMGVIAAYTDYVHQFPADSLAPEFLFRAADLAQGIRHDSMAIGFYHQILDSFPEYAKRPVALFMLGFLYQEYQHQPEIAKGYYHEFLSQYPTHPMAPSAEGALQQLESGMSDEELIRLFEARQDSLEKTGM